MSLSKAEFPNIGETLYNGTLENGLRIVVVPRPGFMKKYAFFATNYGGSSVSDSRFLPVLHQW